MPVYGGGKASTKSTELTQIHRGNLDELATALRWETRSNAVDLEALAPPNGDFRSESFRTVAPVTYLAVGKQFIVFPVGGILANSELIALSLSH